MAVRPILKRIGEKSFTLQQMLRNSATGQICSMCESVMVSVDYATRTSKPIPGNILTGLSDWM